MSTIFESRLYLSSTQASAISPAFSALWNFTSDVDRRAAATTKAGSAFADTENLIPADASPPVFVAVRQYVSPPLIATSLALSDWVTLRGICRAWRATAEASESVKTQCLPLLYDSGGSLKTTIGFMSHPGSYSSATIDETEKSVRLQVFPKSSGIWPLSIDDGDYLVLEVGFSVSSTAPGGATTEDTVYFQFGESAASNYSYSSPGETDQKNPWLEWKTRDYRPFYVPGSVIDQASYSKPYRPTHRPIRFAAAVEVDAPFLNTDRFNE